MRRTPTFPQVAEGAARALGLILIVAAVVKAWRPAIGGDTWLFVGSGSGRYPAGLLLAVVEVVLGTYIMAGAPTAAHRCVTACVAMMMVIVHTHGALTGAERACGCFGRVTVPHWYVVGAGAVGGAAIVCRWRARLQRGAMLSARKKMAIGAVCAMLVGLAVVAAEGAAVAHGPARLAAELASRTQAGDIVIVGNRTCERCRQIVNRLATGREQLRGQGAHARIVVVVPESEWAVPERAVRSEALEVRYERVDDSVWWDAIGVAPPAVFVVYAGGLEPTPLSE